MGGADAHDLILVEILIADCPNAIFVVRNSVESYNSTPTMSNVHNDNEHSVDRSNRKIAPVFVYPALRVMYSTATPCRVSIVTLDGKEATSGISSTPIKL